MALLISEIFKPEPLSFSPFATLEVVGAIRLPDVGKANIISVYCPKGDATESDLVPLFNTANEVLVAGDMNAHNPLWDTRRWRNTCGNPLYRV